MSALLKQVYIALCRLVNLKTRSPWTIQNFWRIRFNTTHI